MKMTVIESSKKMLPKKTGMLMRQENRTRWYVRKRSPEPRKLAYQLFSSDWNRREEWGHEGHPARLPRPRQSALGVRKVRHTKVANLDHATIDCPQQVCGLDVSMDDSFVM
jgi:hypothetical protein